MDIGRGETLRGGMTYWRSSDLAKLPGLMCWIAAAAAAASTSSSDTTIGDVRRGQWSCGVSL